MNNFVRVNVILNIMLSVLVVSIIAIFLNCSAAYAEPSDDWRDFIETHNWDFVEGWEGAGASGNTQAYRYKHIDEDTILEEIYGTGEFFGMGIIPKNGEKLIIDIGDEFTSIQEDAFNFDYKAGIPAHLSEVILPDSITTIGDRAFYDCKALSSINLPEGITTIGEEAFYGCESLESITFPSQLQYIKEYAFHGCAKIKSIITPESTKKVSEDAFYGCTGLTSVTFTGNNATIESCIGQCPNIEKLTIGKGIRKCSEIENSFKKLKTVYVNTNTKYEGDLLYNKTPMTKVIYTGTGTVKDLNLLWQPKLKTVVINNGVKGIAYRGLNYFTHVTSITIPASVKTIGTEAFSHCKNLKSLTIGSGVTKLGKDMVFECKRLKTITIKSKKFKKKTVKGCLTDSKVKTIKVKVGTAKENKKYVKKYKRIFTEKNAGRRVKVK